ncbi:WAT1-related protein [Raphanus sativus]|uniref:WAT1-related protein n=1 Tax=Raphanus sativus TaxID=3726 RepID=A0A6J0P4D7_RAPSA|nr:WAT1-related protein At3g56620 [Raphanus sativus]KAJ4905109.1 WAT1-related protein [Raphanus sativus]
MVLKMSESAKPYFAMVCLQFGYAGMNLVTKVVLDGGMSHFVLVAYRNAFATAAIAPFALLSERKVRPKMTFPIFMQIFVLALLGPVIDQNLYYAGLRLTSPTFAGAVTCIVPALTFIISVIFRMEKVELRKVRFQAKVVGTLVIVVGAMLMILFKSPLINFLRSHLIREASSSAGEDYLKATVFLLIASFSWASFFVLQAATLNRYSSHLSLSTMVCFMGTLQSTALGFVMEPNLSAWNIAFDMNFLASAYAGIMSSSIAYYVQGMMTKQKSVVFVTSFNPLIVIIVSIISFLILGQRLYLGGVLGMVILMVGVCAILWGKEADQEENSEDKFVEVIKCCKDCGNNSLSMPRIDEEVDVEMQSTKKDKMGVDLF